MKVLPPKLYQDPNDPYFDPIRHENWFPRLVERGKKLPRLRMAYKEHIGLKASQKGLCALWNIRPREFRDYVKYREILQLNALHWFNSELQAIMDGAYYEYCSGYPESFASRIQHVASLFGKKGRTVQDLWDLHPFFYPTGYPKPNLTV